MDLTKITTPFGLLDDETQDALKAWPHGWEIYAGVNHPEWARCVNPDSLWIVCRTYRARSAPPREYWINRGPTDGKWFVMSEEPFYAPDQWIHVREVMDGDAQ